MEMQQKIEIIRNQILNSDYPRAYEPDSNARNCYAYALGCDFPDYDRKNNFVFNLGVLSGKDFDKDINTVIQAQRAFEADMRVLGIKCRKSYCDEKLKKNEWKVILFFRISPWYKDFHFIRQDKDGRWSQKKGLFGSISRIDSYPEEASSYELVGCFALKVIRL